MSFDYADDEVDSLGFTLLRRLEHFVGLSHAGAHAKKNLEPPALGGLLLALDLGEQRIRVWSLRLSHDCTLTCYQELAIQN